MLSSKIIQRVTANIPVYVYGFHTSTILERARMGTKMRRDAAKIAKKKEKLRKAEARAQLGSNRTSKFVDKRLYPKEPFVPLDDVYYLPKHHYQFLPLTEAIECHRQTHHPYMWNQPNAPALVKIETTMAQKKKNTFLDTFSGIIQFPHPFSFVQKHSILAFVKDDAEEKAALEAGAKYAVTTASVKKIQSGKQNISSYDYIVCSTDMLEEISSIRRVARHRFPNVRRGTTGADVVEIIKKLVVSYRYTCDRDRGDLDYGLVEAEIGTLDMPVEHLAENLQTLALDIESYRPPHKPDKLITRIFTTARRTEELIEVEHKHYVLPEA